MEFGEKLLELRKSKNITQEELAKELYVSRTAISKWEAGRGYPSIDSLKEIAKYFSVSIDDLLSAESMVTIAKEENKANIRRICNVIFGVVDIMTLALIFLPIYPELVDGYYYAVNLFDYIKISEVSLLGHWIIIVLLAIIGIAKIIITLLKQENINKVVTVISMVVGIVMTLFLVMAREPYAAAIIIVMLVIKGALILKMR